MSALGKLFKFWGSNGSGSSATWVTLQQYLSGSKVNWGKEAGRLYDNSGVQPSINLLWRLCQYPRFTVQTESKASEGTKRYWREVPEHPLTKAWYNSAEYDYPTLLYGKLLGWLCYGEVFLWKERYNTGLIKGFTWIPNHLVIPKADKYNEFGTRRVTYYEYRPPGSGETIEILAEDMLHLRHGVDPQNPMRGISPIHSALRDVVTDNLASAIIYALISNGGIAGLVLSPKSGKAEFPTPAQRETFLGNWKRRTMGDKAGTPNMLPFPVDVVQLGQDMNKLGLDKVKAQSVSRILSSYGIDPMVLGLPSDSKTYDNYAEALDSLLENVVLPTLEVWSKQVEFYCRQDFYTWGPSYRVHYDTSEVRGLQDDKDKEATRVGNLYDKGIITRLEAKSELGYGVDEKRDNVYQEEARASANLASPPTIKALIQHGRMSVKQEVRNDRRGIPFDSTEAPKDSE